MPAGLACRWEASPLEIIVESLLRPAEAQHRPDRGRLVQRQPHLRGGALPQGPLVREQLVHLVRLVGLDAQLEQRHLEDRLLRREGVQADRHQDLAGAVLGRLRVEDHAVVVRLVEAEVPVLLQRRVLVTDPVERGDPGPDVPWPIEVALHELVLLRVQVFLLAWQGAALAQLEARVDAPGRGERRGQRRAREERRPASLLQLLGQDVRRVGPQVAQHVLGGRALGQLLQVLLRLVLEVPPGEVGVRLVEAGLGQRLHHLRARERLREEDSVRVAPLHLADHPLPEREGLGVRVVDAEDAHALLDPVEEHGAQLRPERLARGPHPIEVDDVLVPLGGVLGGLDGPVRAALEPLWVLLHVRVVGRALERDVVRHLDPALGGALHEPAEVGQRAQLRMDRLVAALRAADGPRAADVVGRGGERVVLALAPGAPDGMDGRQVDHVEAQLLHVGQHAFRVRERAVATRLAARRAREQLVPGAEDGALPLGEDAQLPVGTGGHSAVRISRRGFGEARIERARQRPRRLPGEQRLLALAQPLCIECGRGPRRGGALGRGAEKLGAFEQLGGHVAPRLHLARQLLRPGAEGVGPRLHLERVQAVLVDRELPFPGVVPKRPHGHLATLGRMGTELPPAKHDRQLVVPFLEHVGGHAHGLAGRALHGMAAAIDLRLHVLDEDAPLACGHPVAPHARNALEPEKCGAPARAADLSCGPAPGRGACRQPTGAWYGRRVPAAGLARRIGLFDATMIVMGGIVGSGIFVTPADVARSAGSPALILGAWVVGGVAALLGAFVYGWALLLVIQTGGMAATAIAFARYFRELLPIPLGEGAVAAAAVGALTVLKICALAALIGAGLFFGGTAPSSGAPGSATGFGAALIPVLFAYGGWQTACFVAGEMKDPRRDLPRALLLGVAGVIALYTLVAFVCLRTLGADGLARSSAPALEVMTRTLGRRGALAIAAGISISTLGFLSQSILTAPQGALAIAIALAGTFEAITRYVVSMDFVFFALTGACIFVFRRRGVRGTFAIPGHPATTGAFIAICAAVVFSTWRADPVHALAGLGITLAGIPAFLLWRSRSSPTAAGQPGPPAPPR